MLRKFDIFSDTSADNSGTDHRCMPLICASHVQYICNCSQAQIFIEEYALPYYEQLKTKL